MKQRLVDRKTQNRMLGAMLLFLVYIFIVWGTTFHYLTTTLQKRACTNVCNMVEERCSSVSNFFDGQFDLLRSMSDYIVGEMEEKNETQILSFFQGMAEGSGMLDYLLLSGADGQALCSTGNLIDISQRTFFRNTLTGEQELLIAQINGSEYMVLAVPVRSADGQVTHVLAGAMAMERVNELIFTRAAGETEGYCILTDTDGTLLSFSGDADAMAEHMQQDIFALYAQTNMRWGDLEQIRSDLSRGEGGGLMLQNDETKQWYYTSYSPLPDITGRCLFYLVEAETADGMYGFVQLSMVMVLALLLVGVVGLLSFCLWLMFRRNLMLEEKARQDSLTRLLNHDSMRSETTRVLQEETDNGQIHMLLLFDLDEFKAINDNFGHQAGDQVLVAVGDRLRSIFRSTDLMARTGGDEFMVLMRNISGEKMGLMRAQQVCRSIHTILLDNWPDLEVGCSVGAAFFPGDGLEYGDLYRQADLALYQAKRTGRHQVVSAHPVAEKSE